MEQLRGRLLISSGGLFDPNFRHTVVLVVDHDGEGALGVVLNRPAEVTVSEAVPALAEVARSDDRLFIGGPVAPETPLILAEFEHPGLADKPVFDRVGLAAVETASGPGVGRARVFAGHAGWGPGQLEGELASNSWIVEPARADDVFTARPEALWRDVLARKGGRYRLLAAMPFDPATN